MGFPRSLVEGDSGEGGRHSQEMAPPCRILGEVPEPLQVPVQTRVLP
jgi:hypothetical protein